jgi:hypothetical protein
MKDGCDNCPEYDYGDFDSLSEHTTANFSGMIAMMMAKDSWVAKWNHLLPGHVPGVYATQVNEELTLANDEAQIKDDDEDMDEEEESEMSEGPKNLS